MSHEIYHVARSSMQEKLINREQGGLLKITITTDIKSVVSPNRFINTIVNALALDTDQTTTTIVVE